MCFVIDELHTIAMLIAKIKCIMCCWTERTQSGGTTVVAGYTYE